MAKKTTKSEDTVIDIAALYEEFSNATKQKDVAVTPAEYAYIRTHLLPLNLVISGGMGLPTRRIYEISGPEGAGKTALLLEILRIVAAFYKWPIFYFDQETPISDHRLACYGLIKGVNVYYDHEVSIEALFAKISLLHGVIRKDNPTIPIIIAIDPVATIPPNAHLSKKIEDDPKPGAIAKAWAEKMRAYLSEYFFSNITIIFTNQLTEKMQNFGGGFGGGPQTTTPGGRGLKHAATVRIEVSRVMGGTIKNPAGAVIGQEMRVSAKKNKEAPPFQDITLPLFYGRPDLPPAENYMGIQASMAMFNLLKANSVIKTSGSWSYIELPSCTDGAYPKWQGVHNWPPVYAAHQLEIDQLATAAFFTNMATNHK